MKKKLLLVVLPMLLLGACAGENPKAYAPKNQDPLFERGEEDGIVTVRRTGDDSEFSTYLMMSPFGYLSLDGAPVKGAVSELFLENTIVWKAEPGTDLPDASYVKSTVSGTTFRGWAYYEEKDGVVWPTYFDKVPTTEGLQLKAMFDGTDAGGNSGGGGGGGGSGGGGGTTQTGFGIIKGTTPYIGEYKGANFEGYEEYLVKGVEFAVNDTFALYDPSTLGTWTVDINPYSFSPDPEHATSDPERVASYVTKGATVYTVHQAFTGDFYIQIMYQQDRLYIQLA